MPRSQLKERVAHDRQEKTSGSAKIGAQSAMGPEAKTQQTLQVVDLSSIFGSS